MYLKVCLSMYGLLVETRRYRVKKSNMDTRNTSQMQIVKIFQKSVIYAIQHLRQDQVKFVKDSFMSNLKLYGQFYRFTKGCFPQFLLSQFLSTLYHIQIVLKKNSSLLFSVEVLVFKLLSLKLYFVSTCMQKSSDDHFL